MIFLLKRYNGEYYYGRSYEMAPEIDANVLFKSSKNIEIGELVKVKIIKNMDYDLVGVVDDESCK